MVTPPSGLARGPRIRFRWQWVFASPLVVATWLLMLGGGLVAARANRAVREGAALQREIDSELAALVAEEAAFTATAAPARFSGPTGVAERLVIAGVPCSVGVGTGDLLHIQAETRGAATTFACQVLPGAISPLFGVPLALCGSADPSAAGLPAAAHFPAEAMPQLLSVQIGDAVASGVIERDDSIALLRLPGGTDAVDWVLGGSRVHATVQVPRSGVIEVPGNLWLDGASRTLELRLDRDALLVVRGNFYACRSLSVVGPGHLYILVDGRHDNRFADRDGNGRWSAGDELLASAETRFTGDIEGSGSVWFGLPGQPDTDRRLDAGCVITGQLHLGAGATQVTGPLILRHGVTRLGDRATLLATGERLPDLERDLVPGFAVVGGARPGRLFAIAGSRQTLYPPASPR